MTVGRDSKTAAIGAGTLYLAPIGTAEPTSLTGALDVGFVDLGYTTDGSVFTSGSTTQTITPAEEYYPITTIVTEKTSTVGFALMEITAKNLSVAMNGGTITSPAGGGVMYEPPAPGAEVRCMLVWQSNTGDERYLFRQCFQTSASARNMKKVTPAADLPCLFNLEKPTGKLPWAWFGSPARSGS